MFGILEQLRQMRNLYQSGDIKGAAKIAWQLVGTLTGWSSQTGAPQIEGEPEELEQALVEVEAFNEEIATTAQPKTGGGAIFAALLSALGPMLAQLLKDKLGK